MLHRGWSSISLPPISLGCRLLQSCTLTTTLVLTFYLLSFLLQSCAANPSNSLQEIEIKMAIMAIRTLQPLLALLYKFRKVERKMT